MDGMAYQDYFLQPTNVRHRRYEALRAVFVDGYSLQEAAQRFGVNYGTIRNWISEFCRQRGAGQLPPFSRRRLADDQQSPTMTPNRSLLSPMSRRCPWRRGGA
ncbi:hypothetical protein BH10PLA2_BH10PLA2_24460 [soil metagenome]